MSQRDGDGVKRGIDRGCTMEFVSPEVARVAGDGGFSVRRYVKKPGRLRSLHYHDFFELELIVDGSASMTANGCRYALGRGSMFLMRPMDVHRYEVETGELVVWSLRFGSEMVDGELLAGVISGAVPVTRTEDTAYAETLCRRAEREGESGDAYSALVIRRIVSELIVMLLRGREQSSAGGSAAAAAAAYISASYARPLTAKSIADAVGLSPNYLGRIFLSEMCMPLMQYVKRVRLSAAACRVAGTDLPLQNIALECGFGSAAVFSREFKALYGMTPREYREKHLQTN